LEEIDTQSSDADHEEGRIFDAMKTFD